MACTAISTQTGAEANYVCSDGIITSCCKGGTSFLTQSGHRCYPDQPTCQSDGNYPCEAGFPSNCSYTTGCTLPNDSVCSTGVPLPCCYGLLPFSTTTNAGLEGIFCYQSQNDCLASGVTCETTAMPTTCPTPTNS